MRWTTGEHRAVSATSFPQSGVITINTTLRKREQL